MKEPNTHINKELPTEIKETIHTDRKHTEIKTYLTKELHK